MRIIVYCIVTDMPIFFQISFCRVKDQRSCFNTDMPLKNKTVIIFYIKFD